MKRNNLFKSFLFLLLLPAFTVNAQWVLFSESIHLSKESDKSAHRNISECADKNLRKYTHRKREDKASMPHFYNNMPISIRKRFPEKNLPYCDSTSFSNFTCENPLTEEEKKYYALSCLHDDCINYNIYPHYTLTVSNEFTSLCFVFVDKNKMWSELINYDSSGNIIDRVKISYALTTERGFRLISEIGPNGLETIENDSYEGKRGQGYKIESNGKFIPLEQKNTVYTLQDGYTLYESLYEIDSENDTYRKSLYTLNNPNGERILFLESLSPEHSRHLLQYSKDFEKHVAFVTPKENYRQIIDIYRKTDGEKLFCTEENLLLCDYAVKENLVLCYDDMREKLCLIDLVKEQKDYLNESILIPDEPENYWWCAVKIKIVKEDTVELEYSPNGIVKSYSLIKDRKVLNSF